MHDTKYAIYLDSDMVVYDDLIELVKESEKSENSIVGVQQRKHDLRGNQSSVIVFKLYKMKKLTYHDIDSILKDYHNGNYSYEDIFKTLKPFGGIDYSISWKWNCLDFQVTETKLLHYTNMETQPWLSSVSPLASAWERNLNVGVDSELIKKHKKMRYVRPNLGIDSRIGYLKELFWYPPGNIPTTRPWLFNMMRAKYIGNIFSFSLRLFKALRSKRERIVFLLLVKLLISGRRIDGTVGIFENYE